MALELDQVVVGKKYGIGEGEDAALVEVVSIVDDDGTVALFGEPMVEASFKMGNRTDLGYFYLEELLEIKE